MSLRVAYNRASTPLVVSDEGHVLAAGSFGVVSSTDDAVKALLEPDEPLLRLLTPSELKEPTGKQPPHRDDLIEALAELDRRQAEADAGAAAETPPVTTEPAKAEPAPAKAAAKVASTATISGA